MVTGDILIGGMLMDNRSAQSASILRSKDIRDKASKTMMVLFSLFIIAVLFVGWRLRDYHLIKPRSGVGYLLGIAGLGLMALLMVYPLRKRIPALRVLGNMKTWFRIHMVLGIIGPVLVLFHTNFHLGSLNSNVVLFAMLTVSLSGILGRYFYSKIHHGLYGHRASLVSLREELGVYKDNIDKEITLTPDIKSELSQFVDQVLAVSPKLSANFHAVLMTKFRARLIRYKINRLARQYFRRHTREHHWSFKRGWKMEVQWQRKGRRLLAQAVTVAEFSFYERMFALWHMLHVPLVYILFLGALVHVIAVNLY
jgi:hypothetical protein